MTLRFGGRQPRIAIIDPACPKGYEPADLITHALGGTEATVLRVCRGLQQEFAISLQQNNRLRTFCDGALEIGPLREFPTGATPDVAIVINRWKVALKLRKYNPGMAIFLWLHTYPGRHNRKMGEALARAKIPVICVSETHAARFAAFCANGDTPKITYIYNPIDNDLRANTTPRNRAELLFASSPHKGLGQVFAQFQKLRSQIPELSMAVADPGYLRWQVGPIPEGVRFLGSLSHPMLIEQMRKCLCLFYPQTSFAETFGLVLAEANAVGTPVLVQKGLGANDEIVQGKDQRIDARNPDEIAARIKQWRVHPPLVAANDDFRLGRVAAQWRELLHKACATDIKMQTNAR